MMEENKENPPSRLCESYSGAEGGGGGGGGGPLPSSSHLPDGTLMRPRDHLIALFLLSVTR